MLDEETTARNRSVLLASLDSVLIAELTRADAVCDRGHDGINEVWSVNKTSRNGIRYIERNERLGDDFGESGHAALLGTVVGNRLEKG